MSIPTNALRPTTLCLRCTRNPNLAISLIRRSFTAKTLRQDEASLQSTSSPPRILDPMLVSTRKDERELIKSGLQPIGSRRRRAALQNPNPIPFEQLPYQCFQEARKILAADREEKLKQIEEERKRIAKWQARDAAESGGEASRKGRLIAMQKHLQHLKILADINDPTIKMRFEDGQGDMNRPIYRYLADRKWRKYQRLLIMQRITQMHIVPDILPHLDPIAEVNLGFGRRDIKPGEFVDSRVSEVPPRLKVQVFDKGERLIHIVVVDPDIPDETKDSFGSRCHYVALNIPLSPTNPSVPLSRLGAHAVLPWLPPYSQKGAPYHRMTVFVLEHREGKALDTALVKEKLKREGFSLHAFNDRFSLKAVGVTLFRTIWDEGTAEVMARAGVEGADVEFTRKKPEKLPYKKKDGARFR